METIVCASAKGGVLKTSLATTLADLLVRKGKYRTLLIDMDFQANTTKVNNASQARNIYEVLTGKRPIRTAIQNINGLHMIAASRELAGLELHLTGKDRATKLRDSLKGLEGDYDFVIVDTTPQLNLSTLNALVAADSIIIPTQADLFSMDGIENLALTLESVKKVNPDFKIRGLLRTRYNDRTNLNRYASEELGKLAQKLETKVFDSYIRENIKAKEAQMLQQPLFDYDPKSNAAQDYLALYRELGFRENE